MDKFKNPEDQGSLSYIQLLPVTVFSCSLSSLVSSLFPSSNLTDLRFIFDDSASFPLFSFILTDFGWNGDFSSDSASDSISECFIARGRLDRRAGDIFLSLVSLSESDFKLSDVYFIRQTRLISIHADTNPVEGPLETLYQTI